MSKVVTIPKDRNPFVVIVNGVKHSYPAGVSTEVPDEVADVIEKYVGAKPKPDPNANAGGGVSSWNDLKDKPFGESPTGGDTLYWDGNTEGLVSVADSFYKVSDAIVSMADLANGCIVTAGTGAVVLTPDQVIEIVTGLFMLADGLGIFVTEDAVGVDIDGLQFPESGVYFTINIPVSGLTIPGYTGFPGVKKIDIKYLPIEELKVALGIGG